ncbi:hypothetical protein AC578_6922 [Pseudocercospora eumusae]|uniref:Uncharacterized protein n=1 Tax=Pseudocercospora eumusae TaxID=321146 RepID=A0A139H2F2_9PEZI|nr:hypothetical protein AC578_6922 [Pseudocercospora eumusae]
MDDMTAGGRIYRHRLCRRRALEVLRWLYMDSLPRSIDLLTVSKDEVPRVALTRFRNLGWLRPADFFFLRGLAEKRFQSAHDFEFNLHLVHLALMCYFGRHWNIFNNERLSKLPIPHVKELEILIQLPSPQSRAGDEIKIRVMWDEQEDSVTFDFSCPRQSDDDWASNEDRNKVPRYLEELGSAATSRAVFHDCTVEEDEEVYLGVKPCLNLLHDTLCTEGNLTKLLYCGHLRNGLTSTQTAPEIFETQEREPSPEVEDGELFDELAQDDTSDSGLDRTSEGATSIQTPSEDRPSQRTQVTQTSFTAMSPESEGSSEERVLVTTASSSVRANDTPDPVPFSPKPQL